MAFLMIAAGAAIAAAGAYPGIRGWSRGDPLGWLMACLGVPAAAGGVLLAVCGILALT